MTLAAMAGVWLFLGGQAAHAAFPGLNGKIAFDRTTGLPFKAASSRYGSAAWHGRATSRGGTLTDQIWTINPDGSAPLNISNGTRLDQAAAWSADGTKIAFASADTQSSNLQIWVMNADGSGQAKVLNDPNSDDFDPAWSPDGTQIVYTHRNAVSGFSEIWAMNADSTNNRLLVPNAGTDDNNAVWSPDGTKIAFDRSTEAVKPQLYVANADGSGVPQNISNDADIDQFPNWSPDGTRLVFAKVPTNSVSGAFQIWIMNADGSGQHAVTTPDLNYGQPGSHEDWFPAWSPDGTQIVYQYYDGAPGPLQNQQTIWMVAPDGSGNHQVSTPGVGNSDQAPDWQPVGSPASAATLPACTPTGSVVVHVADATGFKSALNLHYKVDGGAEQVAAVDAAGNAVIAAANGTRSIEFWAGDAAGYQEAQHHTASLVFDTVHKCAPRVAVAGVRRACVAKAFRIRVHASTIGTPKSVRVFLGKKRVISTTKTSFTLKINPKRLAHRTRLRIVVTDSSGKVTTIRRTITRCAVAKPRRHVAPRFTG